MCELENELLGVKSNLTKSNKSLQECHQLICNQTAVASRKLEEEQKSHDNEKFRLERELNEFKIRFITLEEEKGRIEKENSRSSQQVIHYKSYPNTVRIKSIIRTKIFSNEIQNVTQAVLT